MSLPLKPRISDGETLPLRTIHVKLKIHEKKKTEQEPAEHKSLCERRRVAGRKEEFLPRASGGGGLMENWLRAHPLCSIRATDEDRLIPPLLSRRRQRPLAVAPVEARDVPRSISTLEFSRLPS
ncbi:hypothetical protein CDAR_172331 [Caerostris darwini]|uniref:Uncharacterized protein n=1 Tax=Caerostris darwini TaxID=1538125 RepID=A0AAV4ME80_9ARAC|nr:hypothetical protein CDAR_172331 [Caerostris darwini]